MLVGEITVRRALDDGRVVELDRAGPGDVFGEMALISPAPRSGSAVAECEALRSFLHTTVEQLDKHPDLVGRPLDREAAAGTLLLFVRATSE